MPALALAPAARTDPGPVRPANEDSVFASPRLLAVADGVGGAAAGEVASAVVIDQLILMDKSRLAGELGTALEAAVRSGNASLGFVAGCRPAMAGMSTTPTRRSRRRPAIDVRARDAHDRREMLDAAAAHAYPAPSARSAHVARRDRLAGGRVVACGASTGASAGSSMRAVPPR